MPRGNKYSTTPQGSEKRRVKYHTRFLSMMTGLIKLSIYRLWGDRQNAEQFFNSPQLVKIRADAGVKSPEFIYLDLLEAGVL